MHREELSETSQEFPKDVCAALTACVSHIDHQNLVRDDCIEQRKRRTADMVFPDAIEILEAGTALGMRDDRPLSNCQSSRHSHNVELWMTSIITAHPPQTGFRS